jgi:hypothetical protein
VAEKPLKKAPIREKIAIAAINSPAISLSTANFLITKAGSHDKTEKPIAINKERKPKKIPGTANTKNGVLQPP